MEGRGDGIIAVARDHIDHRLTTPRLLALLIERDLDASTLRLNLNETLQELENISLKVGYMLRLLTTIISEHPEYMIHPDYVVCPAPIRKAVEYGIENKKTVELLKEAPTTVNDDEDTPTKVSGPDGHKLSQ